MKHPLRSPRLSAHIAGCFFTVLFAALLVAAPHRALAQSPAPAATSQPSAASTTPAPAAQEPQKTEGNSEEEHFLHAPVVQSVARLLHLNLDTTVALLFGINFAIIFFAIAIPLARMMPKIFRKRTQNLSHDLTTARQATAEAQARLSAVEAKLAGLDEEMKKLRAQVELDSLEDEKRIKASIGEESARIVAAAEQEIDVAATQARRGLRNFAAELAVEQAAGQLKLTPDTDRALIAEFISGVAKDAPGKGGQN